MKHNVKDLYILSCGASRPSPGKLKIVFNSSKNYKEETKYIYLLPDDAKKFKELPREIYTISKDIIPEIFNPDKINDAKKNFINKFIKYTLNDIDLSTCSIDDLNKHYDQLFAPYPDDVTKLNQLGDKNAAALQELIKEEKKKNDDALADYKAKQEKLIKSKIKLNDAPIPHSLDEDMMGADGSFNPSVVGNRFNMPKSKGRRPVLDQSGLSPGQQAVITDPTNEGANSGVLGDRLIEQGGIPTLLYPGDREWKGENNAGLLCTRDFIYGEKANTNAGACFLYAGKNAPAHAGGESIVRQIAKDLLNPLGLEEQRDPRDKKRPDLISDCAYLYLSQKADSETLLKIAGGTYTKVAGRRKGQSLAAMKADGVVLIARESGIRLITATDTSNSKGGDLSSKFGIDLIAGNDDENLQPLVLGNNLHTYLETLSKSINDVAGIAYDFLFSQISFNSTIAFHTHYDPFLIFLGTCLGDPLGVLGGKNILSPEVAKAGTKSLLEQLKSMGSHITQSINHANNDLNGLQPFGAYYWKSDRNRTN